MEHRKLTLEDLYNEAYRFLWHNYGMGLHIPIEIEPDFITEEGAYEHTAKSPRRILIAEFVMQFGTDEVIFDVLRHELVHYALHVRRKPFADGCSYFENELKRLGVGSTESSMIGLYYLYECECCGGVIEHPVKVDLAAKLVTVCCEAKFKDLNQTAIFDGKERIY